MELGSEGWPGAHQASRGWRWGSLGCIPTRGSSPTTPFGGNPRPRERRGSVWSLILFPAKASTRPTAGAWPHVLPRPPLSWPQHPFQGPPNGEGPGAVGSLTDQGAPSSRNSSLLGLHAKARDPGARRAGSLGGWKGGSVRGLSQPLVSPGTLGVTQPAPSPPVLPSSSHRIEGHPNPGDLTLRPLINHPCRALIST